MRSNLSQIIDLELTRCQRYLIRQKFYIGHPVKELWVSQLAIEQQGVSPFYMKQRYARFINEVINDLFIIISVQIQEMKLEANDIWPIIYNFLQQCGFPKLAEKLKKKAEFKVSKSKFNSLNLLKAVKYYCKEKSIEKVESAETNNHSLVDQEDQQNHQEKQDSNKNKQKDKKNQSKKEKKSKKDKILPEKQEKVKENKNSNEKEKDKEQTKETDKKEKETSQENQQLNGHEETNSASEEQQNNQKRKSETKDAFENYKRQKFGNFLDQQLRVELKDNSVQAKTKFGTQGDQFAEKGDKMLKYTRGKDFRKQKGKLKNKNFGIGGKINMAVNSVKL